MQHDKKPEEKPNLFRRLVNYCETQVLAFARDSQRSQIENQSSILRQFGIEIVLALGMLLFFLSTFGPVLMLQADRWFSYKPVLSIPADRWHIQFVADQDCPDELPLQCPGHPENEVLWKSTALLSDDNFQNVVKEYQDRKFWMGLELSPEDVRTAFESEGSVLGLGMFNAGYRLFINGVQVDKGSGRDILPVTIQLPYALLKKGEKIMVAIEIDHYLHSRIPTWFIPGKMNGIFTYDQAKAMTGYWIFAISYRPLFNSIWSALFALVFISLWISVPKKVEYFYFSLYMFVYCLIQTMPFAPITSGVDRSLLYERTYWLVAFEGTLGALLGASFARLNRTYTFWVMLVGAIVSLGGYFSSADHVELYFFKDALMVFYIPTMFLLGGFFCYSQAILLRNEWKRVMTESSSKSRRRRLIAFGTLLSLFGFFFLFFQSPIMSVSYDYLARTVQMILLVLIGINLFSDYRDREKQFELVQRSPFHDPFGGNSPEVFGFLVSLDLIKSSRISNYSAESNSSIRPITLWNIHIGKTMARHRGYKVGDEGDGLKVFFRCENNLEELLKVMSVLRESMLETKNLEKSLTDGGLIPQGATLRFRSGVVWGGLNPIWKEFVGVKSAEWEDAKGYSTFKDVQRIMEVEKTLDLEEGLEETAIVATHHDLELGQNGRAQRMEIEVRDVGSISIVVVNLAGEKILQAS